MARACHSLMFLNFNTQDMNLTLLHIDAFRFRTCWLQSTEKCIACDFLIIQGRKFLSELRKLKPSDTLWFQKGGKNKKVAHKAIAECVTDSSYLILTSSVICYWRDAWQHGIYLFYILIKKQKSFQSLAHITRRPAFVHHDVNLFSIQNEAISWIGCYV